MSYVKIISTGTKTVNLEEYEISSFLRFTDEDGNQGLEFIDEEGILYTREIDGEFRGYHGYDYAFISSNGFDEDGNENISIYYCNNKGVRI